MLNVITIQGRLTKNAEFKYLPSGTGVLQFTLACERDFKRDDQQDTDFISCIWFGKQCEKMHQYMLKGRMFLVSGRLQVRKYDKDGKTQYFTEVMVDRVNFCDSQKNDDQPAGEEVQRLFGGE